MNVYLKTLLVCGMLAGLGTLYPTVIAPKLLRNATLEAINKTYGEELWKDVGNRLYAQWHQRLLNVNNIPTLSRDGRKQLLDTLLLKTLYQLDSSRMTNAFLYGVAREAGCTPGDFAQRFYTGRITLKQIKRSETLRKGNTLFRELIARAPEEVNALLTLQDTFAAALCENDTARAQILPQTLLRNITDKAGAETRFAEEVRMSFILTHTDTIINQIYNEISVEQLEAVDNDAVTDALINLNATFMTPDSIRPLLPAFYATFPQADTAFVVHVKYENALSQLPVPLYHSTLQKLTDALWNNDVYVEQLRAIQKKFNVFSPKL